MTFDSDQLLVCHINSANFPQNVRYVLGTHDYPTHETSLLRFPAGAVIKLEAREGLDEGKPAVWQPVWSECFQSGLRKSNS